MSHAQPPLEFIPPALNPLVLQVAQLVIPSWLPWGTSITQIEADNVESLVNLYQQFQDGNVRFLMAFRHPRVSDPICMAYLLWHLVPQVAKQRGISLKRPIHAHFIYDRGIPLWAGPPIGWLLPRLGGTPIHRGKADWTGLRSVRNLFANAQLPMAAAPEGATNGHNEIISPLEPGIAQFGFWCVEDLVKAGRSEQVFIVPVGIQYRYIEAPWQSIEKLLGELEATTGLPVAESSESEDALYRRLYRLGEHLLLVMEEFYTRFYHRALTVNRETPVTAGEPESEDRTLTVRLQALLNVALQVAEEYFYLPSKGSLTDRCRRVEQAGWNYIYREELKNTAMSPLEHGLADRIAEEANLCMWHMRLVETFVAVTGDYVLEKPTAERFAETILLLWDMVVRIKGHNPFNRPELGKQRVQMTVGQPISVSERYPTYHANRQGARQAVADLTKDLQHRLASLILPT